MSSDRLVKLLLMLSSPYSGEITTAAKAIGTLLERDGRDWHWLAQCVVECPYRAAETKAKPHAERVPDWAAWDACDIATALLKAGAGRLSQWETDFLESMRWWNGEATAKQDGILRRIADKIGWRP